MSNSNTRYTLALVAALFVGTACSKSQQVGTIHSDQGASIVNGRPVVLTDAFAKHTVAVGPKNEPQCTGVVISAHHVLSAAHCVDVIKGGVVFFGLDFAAATTQIRQIKLVTAHPQYCPSCDLGVALGDTNDLSIVEFAGELPAGFEPIAFAPKELIAKGVRTNLAGYGANENYVYETIMKVTEVPIAEVGSSEFNTDETKSGSCNGDSGGPAYIESQGQMLLAGITSRGDRRCRRIGVYTMPAMHDAWIQSMIASHPVAGN